MRIGFLGAGKVATAFGRYLHDHGITIGGYFDRHPEKTAHACQATRSRAFTTGGDLAKDSDIIFITTQDDKIQAACDVLCAEGPIGPDHLMGHMSGVHSSRILESAAELGAATFSLHPLQAFAQEQTAVRDLPNTYFSLESDDPRTEAVEKLLRTTGNLCFRITPDKKSLYHLAACILSNYLVTVMDSGLAALEASGIDPQEGFAAMQPLITGTLANIARSGPAKALTGPIARGDTGTILAHLDALGIPGLETVRKLYAFLGLQTLELARKEVLKSTESAEAVRKLLETH